MGRPKKSEERDTRQALLKAALDVFSSSGFYRASLRDIARSVGIRESAIYYYFANKESLLDALLIEHMAGEDVEAARRQLLTEPIGDLGAYLEKVCLTILEHFRSPSQQKLFRIFLSDGVRLASEGRLNLPERLGVSPILELMGRLVREGQVRDTRPELLELEFFAPFMMLRHLEAYGIPSSYQQEPQEFARAHVEHFLRGAGVRA